MSIETLSSQETVKLGEKLSRILEKKEVLILEGSLGGGKTTFVKGLARGLGFKGRVLSPSFTLVRCYKLKKLSVYHVDLYRIKEEAMFELGLDEMLDGDNSLSVIEWGSRITKGLDKYIKVEFSFSGENKRKLKFSTFGYPRDKMKQIIEELR